MTTEALKSNSITNLDAQPIIFPTVGEGAPGYLREVDEQLTTTTIGGVGSTYRLCRFPVEAKIKHVHAYIGAVDNNASPTWKADFNVAFSDSLTDGTPPALQGLIPTSALTGLTTTVAAYASPNILFGQKVAGASDAVVVADDITHLGTFLPADKQNPLWNYFGFTNNAGLAQSPGGFFDLMIYVSVVGATPHAGIVGVEVDYVV